MCTLILLDRVVPEFPVMVAANRDEYFARPAAPPARFVPGDGRLAFIAPQDLAAGGTWMGLNSNGLFVGLTNRPVAVRDPAARSRGLLVVDALGQISAGAAVQELHRVCEQPTTPFNLLAADGRETFFACMQADRLETRPLNPGVHVVCNRDPDDPSSGKVRRIEAMLGALDPKAGLEPLVDGLSRLLGAHPHDSNPLENPCVHTAEYGTRSSTVLALGPERRTWRYADGAPCETKYHDFSCLLEDLPQAVT